MGNFVIAYRAVLKLALEMAMELRCRCNEEIHHAQVAVIVRLMAEIGDTQNKPSSD